MMCLFLRKRSSHCRGLPPLFFDFAGVQTCRSSFDAAVNRIVRFTLKHIFAERFESFSVFVPLVMLCVGIVFSLVWDRFREVYVSVCVVQIQPFALVRSCNIWVWRTRGFREFLWQDCGPLPCPVSAFDFGESLSTHPRSSNFDPSWPLARTADSIKLPQSGLVLVLAHMKVLQWRAQSVGLRKSDREDNVCRSNNRRLRAGPSKYTSLWYPIQQLSIRGKS